MMSLDEISAKQVGQAERLIELRRLEKKQKNGTDSGSAGIRKKNKIVAFSSGKGGTGKTFLSLNISYALSLREKKVLFIDLDTNLSNAHIMLNTVPSKTIDNFVNKSSCLKDLISIREMPEFKNLHFIFGDSGRLDYSKLTQSVIEKFFDELQELKNDYDFIILDMSSGAGEEMLNIISKADINLIVTTPEPTSVMDSYVILKFLKAKDYKGSKSIILNKCADLQEGVTAYKNLSSASNHFLKDEIALLGLVENSGTATQSIINQNLLLFSYPDLKISAQINELSRRLIEFITALR